MTPQREMFQLTRVQFQQFLGLRRRCVTLLAERDAARARVRELEEQLAQGLKPE